jgi:hypothetical protein
MFPNRSLDRQQHLVQWSRGVDLAKSTALAVADGADDFSTASQLLQALRGSPTGRHLRRNVQSDDEIGRQPSCPFVYPILHPGQVATKTGSALEPRSKQGTVVVAERLNLGIPIADHDHAAAARPKTALELRALFQRQRECPR